MTEAARPASTARPDSSPQGAETALELLVHGVGGTTPEKMLDDPRTVRITGDETAAVFRRIDDADAERRPRDYRGKPVPEAYVWCNLTSGNGARALWLLLLPFMVVNLAHWMRPAGRGRLRTIRLYGLIVRLTGLTLTVLLVAAACEVALDLAAWQCAGSSGCATDHSWLGFLSPHVTRDGWWTQPGRRLALASAVPAALVVLLWYLAHRTWNAYESQPPLPRRPETPDDADRTALGRPGFWYGRRLVARLRAAHTAAGFLTIAAVVGTPAGRFDREEGGPAILDVLGGLIEAGLAVGAVLVVWVVCCRGRSEHRVDEILDRDLIRRLPAASVALFALTAVYAGWSRPGWRSGNRLPGDAAFGGIVLVQGLLVIALGVVAHLLFRSRPESRTAMRGLAGPAVAMLACALGGVMSGGVAQRVADWLDGRSGSIAGPPVLLTWQASVIPPLLVVLLILLAWLSWRTWRRRRAELDLVESEYGLDRPTAPRGGEGATGDGDGHEPGGDAARVPGEPAEGEGWMRSDPDGGERERRDVARTRRIAGARATARLTDEAPLVIGIVSAVTLLLGAGALIGALTTRQVPAEAARDSYDVVEGAAEAAQALGSWLIGLGFILFVTWGRRAYKDASARRTIGILWDVGTFWPRAAHPFAPPCYAERAVPDLAWRMATWTRATGGRLVISGHSQGSVLAAAAAWQLRPEVRRRVALLTYGSPLERLYGRWFPAHFGSDSLSCLHREVDCWRNLYRLTDPIGGPVRLTGACGPQVDRAALRDPLAYGRTPSHPLPAPILGHSDYQADPAFADEREHLLTRLRPEVPDPRPEHTPPKAPGDANTPGPVPDAPGAVPGAPGPVPGGPGAPGPVPGAPGPVPDAPGPVPNARASQGSSGKSSA
ncbi:hypothetical protein [Streptomyces cavernae]|uniref:hypothetical protein n=1 Tax=Streptomyces cavernae TaxID=2259034 RepID=UPI003B75CDC0